MSFTPENLKRAREIIDRYPHPRSALLPLLHLAQDQDGWLTEEAMREIAGLLGLTPAEVLGTASFYTMYKRTPVGKRLVSVCTNISCLLLGGLDVLEQFEEELGIKCGQTTPDGNATLEEVECLAACGGAPCLQVDYEYFTNVTREQVSEIATHVARGERPPGGEGLPGDNLRSAKETAGT